MENLDCTVQKWPLKQMQQETMFMVARGLKRRTIRKMRYISEIGNPLTR